MRKRLLDVVVCPVCCGDLTLVDAASYSDDDWIEEGKLICAGCSREAPIHAGVPMLLPYAKAPDAREWSFNYQWRLRFAGKLERGNWLWGKDLQQYQSAYKLPTTDCWHLDCGSGSGEHTRNVAKQNPTIQTVGLDISDSVYSASIRDRGIKNLHYVQGTILQPPFRDDSFRVVIAIGVWHATGDTRRALHSSARLVLKHGYVATWLYPNLEDLCRPHPKREYRMWKRYYFFRDCLFLGLAHHLKPAVLLPLCKVVSAAITPFGHIADFDVPDFQERYRSNVFILLDDISPRYQDRPSKNEVREWFREAGIDKVVHSFRRGGVFFAFKT